MGIKDGLTMVTIGVVYLAILYALVRPGSKGPAIVTQVLTVFADLVRGVAGETYDSSTQSWSSNTNA